MSKHLTVEAIENILARFDFETVAAYMKINGWTWRSEKNSPTPQQLRDEAQHLLYNLASKEIDGATSFSMGAGGFYAYLFEYGAKLSFEIQNKGTF